jgi:hypothetical protein
MHHQYARYPMCNDDPEEVPDGGEDIAIWRYELVTIMRSDGARVLLTATRERFGVTERLLDWQGSAFDALGMVSYSVMQDMMVVLGDRPPVDPLPEALPEPAGAEW